MDGRQFHLPLGPLPTLGIVLAHSGRCPLLRRPFRGTCQSLRASSARTWGHWDPVGCVQTLLLGFSVFSYQYDFRLCSVFGVQVRRLFLCCWMIGESVMSNWSLETIDGRRRRDRKTILTHRADPVETESGPVHDAIPNHTLVQQITSKYELYSGYKAEGILALESCGWGSIGQVFEMPVGVLDAMPDSCQTKTYL